IVKSSQTGDTLDGSECKRSRTAAVVGVVDYLEGRSGAANYPNGCSQYLPANGLLVNVRKKC
ncbi:MAG: hypothetical protein O9293_13875, partial [Porphyrobacter sp.]|nr:hypothetical protein [Porphyrobacter sp.]